MSVSLVWNAAAPVRAAGPQRRRVALTQAQAAQPRARHVRRAPHRAWGSLFALAGDVVAVALWAALIPGGLWLGTLAGF